MEPVKKSIFGKILTVVFILTFILALAASFYRYSYIKTYDYLVEASCDPAIENCFYRSCENYDDCPPNQLTIYKEFHVSARDFATCADNSCKQECESGAIRCEPVACDTEAGDSCAPFEQ